MDTLDYCSRAGGLEKLSLAEASPAAADIIVNRTFGELVMATSRKSCERSLRAISSCSPQCVGGRQSCSSQPCLRRRDQVSRCHRPRNAWRVAIFDCVGTMLPGAAQCTVSQDLHFRRPVKPGDPLTQKSWCADASRYQPRRAGLRLHEPGWQGGYCRQRRGHCTHRESVSGATADA